jgi:hypothetical protein
MSIRSVAIGWELPKPWMYLLSFKVRKRPTPH